MTRLLLAGGHTVDVKTPAEDVEDRLSDAGPCITWNDAIERGDQWVQDHTWVVVKYAEFEAPDGRKPVRIRTDSVIAIL